MNPSTQAFDICVIRAILGASEVVFVWGAAVLIREAFSRKRYDMLIVAGAAYLVAIAYGIYRSVML